MTRVVVAAATLAILSSIPGPAEGAMLATQPVFVASSQRVSCKIANVSDKLREVTTEAIRGGALVASETAVIPPGLTLAASVGGTDQNYWCRFTVKGGRRNVRAGANVGTLDQDLFAVPAN